MMTALIVFLSVYLTIACINLFVTWRKGFDYPARTLPDNELPEIAVLVAARNEEHNIEACLQSLVRQDYPVHKMKILVGNDQSDDDTGMIVDRLAAHYPGIVQVHITGQLGQARGKANVLARLAHETQAGYLLITDADIEAPPQWARTLVSFFRPGVGIVSGTTVVNGKGYMGPMQQTDWLYFMGLLLTFDRLGIRSTAVGNNMAITREAYLSTGGYENFEFSVTEDYKLFEQTRKQGWETVNMINPGAINLSAGAPDLRTLMNQRKRWLTGASQLPFYWWIVFGIFGLYLPAVVALFFFDARLGAAFLLGKFILQSITILVQQKMAGIRRPLIHLAAYEVFTVAITLATALFYLVPVKLNWKNRYY